MEKVNFKDKNLEKAIRKKLGKKHGQHPRLKSWACIGGCKGNC